MNYNEPYNIANTKQISEKEMKWVRDYHLWCLARFNMGLPRLSAEEYKKLNPKP